MAIRWSWLRAGRVIAVALLAGAAACSSEPNAPIGDLTPGGPQTSLQKVLLEGYAAGSSEFRVQAASAQLDPEARIARLAEVEIQFADRQSGPVRVEAAEGEFALDRDDFALRGGVVGQTGEGERFETEELRYDDASRSLRSDAPVRMTRSNLEFRGNGMRLDVDSRRLRFNGRVTATSLPGTR